MTVELNIKGSHATNTAFSGPFVVFGHAPLCGIALKPWVPIPERFTWRWVAMVGFFVIRPAYFLSFRRHLFAGPVLRKAEALREAL